MNIEGYDCVFLSVFLACRCSVRVAAPGRQQGELRSRVVTNAVPVAVPFALTLAVVGAAVVALSRKEKLPILQDNTRVCQKFLFNCGLASETLISF